MNSDCTMERCLFMNPNPDKCDVINCQWKTTDSFNAIKQAYDDGYATGKRDKSITSNNWISVNDALPKSSGQYLTAYYLIRYGIGDKMVDKRFVYLDIDSFRGKTEWAKKEISQGSRVDASA